MSDAFPWVTSTEEIDPLTALDMLTDVMSDRLHDPEEMVRVASDWCALHRTLLADGRYVTGRQTEANEE